MITLFENVQFGKVRVADVNNEPIFCLTDLCNSLQLTNSRKVKSQLDEDVTLSYPLETPGGTQNATFVTEAGMYTVILRSDSPLAKPMQRWITGEVLPAIRKTGGYMISKEDDTEADIMARALLIAQSTMERQKQRLELLQNENELQKKELKASSHKVEYFDNVLQSTSVYVADQIAKELGITAITLNKRLVSMGIIMRRNGQLVPTADYCGKGYTKSRTHVYTKNDGSQGSNCITVWTEKGREFILTLMRKQS